MAIRSEQVDRCKWALSDRRFSLIDYGKIGKSAVKCDDREATEVPIDLQRTR